MQDERSAYNEKVRQLNEERQVEYAKLESRLISVWEASEREFEQKAKAIPDGIILTGVELEEYKEVRKKLGGLFYDETDEAHIRDLENTTKAYREARRSLDQAIDAAVRQKELQQVREAAAESMREALAAQAEEHKASMEAAQAAAAESMREALAAQANEYDAKIRGLETELDTASSRADDAAGALDEAYLDLDGAQIAGKVEEVEYDEEDNTFTYGEYTISFEELQKPWEGSGETPSQEDLSEKLQEWKDTMDANLLKFNTDIVTTVKRLLPHGLHGYEFSVEEGKVYLRQPATGKETSFTLPQKDINGLISHDENKSVYDEVVRIITAGNVNLQADNRLMVAIIKMFETRMKAWNAQAAYQEMLQNSQAVEAKAEVPAGMSKEVFDVIQGTTALSLRKE
ncbi:MAG: hypothetical protein H6767_05280 [Candidatus Peribacteria bacterium]|nr:MAG: hypothetical protein H6767_05280 [Candidatus Peribacteria bacterium]